MRRLIILVATTAVVSGLREARSGFAVDYRSFGGTPIFQDLPYREQARSFRETRQPAGQHQHQLQSYRQENFREYRQPFAGRDETRLFRDETRGGFKEDPQNYKNDNRETGFKEELRNFNDESRPFREETRIFKDETRGFREDMRSQFRDERIYRDEIRGIRNGGPRHLRDERPFSNEPRQFREEIRSYRDESRPFRDESRPFNDEIRAFERPINYRDEVGPFRNEARPFREETTIFQNDRPFRDESGPMSDEPRPFMEELDQLSNEPRPFTEKSSPFKDELLFTEESRSLAEAQHRFNKEQQHRQPLSFGGHSNYLKYGNHGLGFASVPAAILPLEKNSPQLTSGMMISDMSTTAATQSPDYSKSGLQATSSPNKSPNTKNHISVTLAPEVGTTPGQTLSGNAIANHAVSGHQRTNENLVDGASTIPTSSAVTISTSGDTSVTPKMVFTSGSSLMSSSPMEITGVDNGVHQAHVASANSLHASKSGIHEVATSSPYFPRGTSTDVPQAVLNYVFKYQLPEDTKQQYTYRNPLQPESFNQMQTLPLIHHHHQTAKYTILPELKIPGLSAMRQSGGALNYVPSAELPKISYLTGNSPALILGAGYSTEGVPSVNYASNLLQLDRDGRFTQPVQTEQLISLHGQNDQYSQLRQLTSNENLSRLGHYGDLGQAQQRNAPFAQGLQLQLGGFGGIDYNALSSDSEASRGTPGVSMGLTELSRQAGPTFTKISFDDAIW